VTRKSASGSAATASPGLRATSGRPVCSGAGPPSGVTPALVAQHRDLHVYGLRRGARADRPEDRRTTTKPAWAPPRIHPDGPNILPGHSRDADVAPFTDNQFSDLVADRWAAWAIRVPPVPSDQTAVPGQLRGRRDNPMFAQPARRQPSERGQHRPIRPRQAWRADLTTQHRDLMPRRQQLRGPGPVSSGRATPATQTPEP